MILFQHSRFEKRRIVITTKELYIALLEDEITRDVIPLNEVVNLEELNNDLPPENGAGGQAQAPVSQRSKSLRTAPLNSEVFTMARHSNVIKISTIEGGYNAGRGYSLQAPSRETSAQVCERVYLSYKGPSNRH